MPDQGDGEVEQEDTKWSPAGFEAPEPEVEDTEVVCAGCGESAPASEMGVTADQIEWTDNDEVISLRRAYIHNDEECMMAVLAGDSDV